jgi:oxalate decarboxylase
MTTASRHVTSLDNREPLFESPLGSVRQVDATSLGVLKNLSIKHIVLTPGAIREPHWNVNANALTYVLAGEVLISVLDTANVFGTFTAKTGQMFAIKSGSVHHIENIGETDAEVIVGLRNELPTEFSLAASFGAMTDSVLGNTYSLPSSSFAPISRDTSTKHLVMRHGDAVVPASAGLPDPHKFDVEAQTPPTNFPYGTARLARKNFWPALENISMYSLRIEEDGMREVHWHPITGEMGYIHEGTARMTILDPDGTTDTYLLEPGDVYFVPVAYPHQIEVTSEGPIHFLIFFDQPTPGDVGFRATGSAFSREVLAATLGVTVEDLPALPFTPVDPLIVSRKNALDPIE